MAQPGALAVVGDPRYTRTLARRFASKNGSEPVDDTLHAVVDHSQAKDQGRAVLKDQLTWNQRIDVHLWIRSSRSDLCASHYCTVLEMRSDHDGVNLMNRSDIPYVGDLDFDPLISLESHHQDMQNPMFVGIRELRQQIQSVPRPFDPVVATVRLQPLNHPDVSFSKALQRSAGLGHEIDGVPP